MKFNAFMPQVLQYFGLRQNQTTSLSLRSLYSDNMVETEVKMEKKIL